MTVRVVDELISFLVDQGLINPIPHLKEHSDDEALTLALTQMREKINYAKAFRQLQSLHELIPEVEYGFQDAADIVEKRAMELFPASVAMVIACDRSKYDEECLPHLDARITKKSLNQALRSKGYFSWEEDGDYFLVLALKAGGAKPDILIIKGSEPTLVAPPFLKMATLFSFFASAALAKGRSHDLLQQKKDQDFKKLFEEEHEKLKRTEKLVLLSQFTVGLNHEINNTLAVIKGALFLMKKSKGAKEDDVIMKNIGRIEEAVTAISEIVQNLENLKRKYHIKEYLKDVHMVDFSIDKQKEE